MGKGIVLLLHLLAVVAGWGMVAGLRPVLSGWAENGRASVENPLPGKSGARVLTADEVAAGRELLLGIEADQRLHPNPFFHRSPELPIEELIDREFRRRGIDPAAPAPTLAEEGESGEEAVEAREYHQVLAQFLDHHLNGEHGPDLAYGFRHGRVDAVAIYDSLATHLPGAAADHTLRRALYRQLAPLDPVRAEALLAPMTEAEATGLKLEIIQPPPILFAPARAVLSPDRAFKLLSSIAPPADESEALQRELARIRVTDEFLEAYGSDYLHWVEALPAGPGRDQASAGLLACLKDEDPASYRRIRLLVTDPRILKEFPAR